MWATFRLFSLQYSLVLTCDDSPMTEPLYLISKLSIETNKADEQDGGDVIGSGDETQVLAGQLKTFFQSR